MIVGLLLFIDNGLSIFLLLTQLPDVPTTHYLKHLGLQLQFVCMTLVTKFEPTCDQTENSVLLWLALLPTNYLAKDKYMMRIILSMDGTGLGEVFRP